MIFFSTNCRYFTINLSAAACVPSFSTSFYSRQNAPNCPMSARCCCSCVVCRAKPPNSGGVLQLFSVVSVNSAACLCWLQLFCPSAPVACHFCKFVSYSFVLHGYYSRRSACGSYNKYSSVLKKSMAWQNFSRPSVCSPIAATKDIR